ncbi:histidine phosphatase family protein [Paenibacillus sp. JZ16]|uniref:histidine phosphatase family protein n=1 Tax=Paenibacillus sp. JZ16 TaxID=1906272 RepID=UPI00188A2225|nr:histidine phosphatase family protein [Paenibacillus sp. JZ16]
MKNVFIVRHCKAEGQAADAPLTGQGIQQALELAEFLSDKGIDHIVSSPYRRASDTIKPLADLIGVEVVMDERLTERILSGRNEPAWREMLRRTYDDLELCYEGGESSRTAMHRAVRVVEEIRQNSSQNAVIVSHGNLISLLLKHYDNRIGFREWEGLSNPDVYHLSFLQDAPGIQRIWTS